MSLEDRFREILKPYMGIGTPVEVAILSIMAVIEEDRPKQKHTWSERPDLVLEDEVERRERAR